MIIGAHAVLSSTNPGADHAFLRDVLRLAHVDDGGYLIFGLPPAEVSVHASDRNDVHQFFLMCDDVNAFVAAMGKRNIRCSPVHDEGWGLLTQVTLPGGGTLGVYQPRHKRPSAARARTPAKKAAATASRRRASRPTKKRKTRAR